MNTNETEELLIDCMKKAAARGYSNDAVNYAKAYREYVIAVSIRADQERKESPTISGNMTKVDTSSL